MPLCGMPGPADSVAKGAISAQPNPSAPGKPVTLHWYFTGNKVVVSGGRFGKGVVVTGRTSLTDTPRKTTRYDFDVWYEAKTTSSKGDSPETGKFHARYSVVVKVANLSSFATYQDTRGWKVGYPPGWKRDNVPLPDPVNNALMYFQKEDDSVERLAISLLPANEMDRSRLMEHVLSSLPNSYEQIEVLSQSESVFAGVPAQWMTFRGMDQSHPGTRTQSIVLAFVRDGRAYVVSARTEASRFKMREDALVSMVQSFTFTKSLAGAS